MPRATRGDRASTRRSEPLTLAQRPTLCGSWVGLKTHPGCHAARGGVGRSPSMFAKLNAVYVSSPKQHVDAWRIWVGMFPQQHDEETVNPLDVVGLGHPALTNMYKTNWFRMKCEQRYKCGGCITARSRDGKPENGRATIRYDHGRYARRHQHRPPLRLQRRCCCAWPANNMRLG